MADVVMGLIGRLGLNLQVTHPVRTFFVPFRPEGTCNDAGGVLAGSLICGSSGELMMPSSRRPVGSEVGLNRVGSKYSMFLGSGLARLVPGRWNGVGTLVLLVYCWSVVFCLSGSEVSSPSPAITAKVPFSVLW